MIQINISTVDENTIEYLFNNYIFLELSKEELKCLAEKVKEYRDKSKDPRAEQLYYSVNSKICQITFNTKGIFEYGIRASQMAKKNDYKVYEAISYNALGNYYRYEGNYLTAFQYFWDGYQIFLELVEENGSDKYAVTCNKMAHNIAACLADSDEYEKAVEYYNRVLMGMSDHDNRSISEEFFLMMVHVNIATNYNNLKQYERAYIHLEKSNEIALKNKDMFSEYYSNILVMNYIISYNMGNFSKADSLLETIQSSKEKWEEVNAMENLVSFLLKTKQYDIFLFFYEPLYSMAVRDGVLKFQIKLVDGLRQYYVEIQDEEGCCKTYTELGKLYVKQIKEREVAMKAAVHSSIILAEKQENQKQQERYKKLLKYKSEYDELTNIPNRYKLTEFCNKIFDKAIRNQISLCVEIIDIDYFKQVNDNYGHTQGDEYLKRVAEQLEKVFPLSENQLCARYGGDEFIVVRLDKDDKEIYAKMEELKETIQELAMPNEYSSVAKIVTISQGAVNRIPQKEDNLSSYLKQADEALYEVKMISRNTMILKK